MFSKISARIFFKVLNVPTISSKGVRLRSLSSFNNIDDPLMRNIDLLQRKQRKTPSSVPNPVEASKFIIRTERKEFLALFPDVLQDITELVEQKYKDKDLVDRIIRALNYTVPSGKQNFGLSLITSYLHLVDAAQLTPENLKMIRLLAWILEMLIGQALVADDIIDEGTIRRNQPCWHLVDDVKLTAINDFLMMENLAHCLLKKYFSHFPCYPKLLDVIHKGYFISVIGLLAENVSSRKGVQHFTMDEFKKAVYHKTSYGGIWLPFVMPTMFIGEKSKLVKQVYEELNLPHLYHQLEDETYDKLATAIKNLSYGQNDAVLSIVNMHYHKI